MPGEPSPSYTSRVPKAKVLCVPKFCLLPGSLLGVGSGSRNSRNPNSSFPLASSSSSSSSSPLRPLLHQSPGTSPIWGTSGQLSLRSLCLLGGGAGWGCRRHETVGLKEGFWGGSEQPGGEGSRGEAHV